MSSRPVVCAQCGETRTRKNTLATNVELGRIYSQSKKMTHRTEGQKEIPRSPSVQAGKVTRVCRGGCKKAEEKS